MWRAPGDGGGQLRNAPVVIPVTPRAPLCSPALKPDQCHPETRAPSQTLTAIKLPFSPTVGKNPRRWSIG